MLFYYLISASLFIALSFGAISTQTGEIVPDVHPSQCDKTDYFNIIEMRCHTCSKHLLLYPDNEGLSCTCNDRSRITKWNGSSFPECSACGINEIPTLDQRDCITCSDKNLIPTENGTICDHFFCPANSLTLERNATGALLDRIECPKCPVGSQPTDDGLRCIPCPDSLCCEKNMPCPPLSDMDWSDDAATYTITYLNGRKIFSQFFRDNLRRSVYLCKKKNPEKCQAVANMCALLLYEDELPHSACALFRDFKRIPTNLGVSALPWLYYGDGNAPSVLGRRRITTHYVLNSKVPEGRLNLSATVFSPEGKFLRMQSLSGHHLQLCPGTWKDLDRSLHFLTTYDHSCTIPVMQLLDGRTTELMDVYLSYQDEQGSYLHAVPILITNMPPAPFENALPDRSQWQLVRRWFLLDLTNAPSAIRFAASITLHIRLQGLSGEGKIFVPYISVQYAEINEEQLHENKTVNLQFKVNYEMGSSFTHNIEVTMGVLSALAVVCAGIRTWSHSKRSGCVGIDLYTLAYLVLFSCGCLANVFFLTDFLAGLYVFLFFKGQSTIFMLLPTASQEKLIEIYVYVAFALKLIELAYLLYQQVTVDIFLVDWERPRARPSVLRNAPGNTDGDDQPVSIWRTYFVANEWNEIQTMRKVNANLHLLITVFILEVLGIKHWTNAAPQIHTSAEGYFGVPDNITCRFTVGGLVYLCVYLVLYIFTVGIYERYIKNGIHSFVDMCSMANISVFILALENYGFYIHGRSAHGFADTDMLTIVQQLRREEEDLVGHRGLQPGSDQQTFEMTVPTALRAYYTKVMAPLNAMSRSVRRPGRNKPGKESVERSVQAYHNMNRFLGAFLDHALKDLDYEVREKVFAEVLLGIEFTSGVDKGVLYSDNGHSFDQILFYGNELTLFTFDIILFSFVQILSKNFLLAGVVTGLVGHIVAELRRFGGRLNLAKKTLTDERFLI